MRNSFPRLIFAMSLLVVATTATAQQPFVTDDADTTPKHRFHFEFSNQFDLLQRSSFPSLKQNSATFALNYGLLDNLEIGVEVSLLTIFNAAGSIPKRISGIGDTNIGLKYNFLKERDNSRRPALAVTFSLELPTGDVKRQLGSGLADFYVSGVVQKSLGGKTKLRLNGGILFSGNETTGVVGIKARGTVLTGGGSLVRQFSPKLQLGVELTAVQKKFQLGKGRLQPLAGGNYQFRENMSFDFAVVGGRYVGSPRAGIILGTSIDF